MRVASVLFARRILIAACLAAGFGCFCFIATARYTQFISDLDSGRSKGLVGIQQDGYRPFVDQFHGHGGLEDAGLHRNIQVPQG